MPKKTEPEAAWNEITEAAWNEITEASWNKITEAAHDVSHVGLRCRSATPRLGCSEGPGAFEFFFKYWSVGMLGCSVVLCPFLRKEFYFKKGYGFKQNGVYL